MELAYRLLSIVVWADERLCRATWKGLPLRWPSYCLVAAVVLASGLAFLRSVHVLPGLRAADAQLDPLAWAGITVGLALLLYGLSVIRSRGHVVFRASGSTSPDAELPAAGDARVHASGTFRHQGNSLWIFDLLVRVKRLEPGVLELAANVQVKARHGRFRVEDRSGRWSMVIRTRFARTIESGRQYTGLSQWPALRVTYTTPSSPRALAAVIRFSHESVRDAIEETVLRESRALRTSSAGGEVA